MAITNFQFPGVELRQVFLDTPVATVSSLGVAVIGQQYKLSIADVDNQDNVMTLNYTAGSSATLAKADLPGYVDGAVIDTAYGATVIVQDGRFINVDTSASGAPIGVTAASSPITAGTSTTPTTASVQMTGHVTGSSAPAGFGGRYVQIGDPCIITGTGSSTANAEVTEIVTGDSYDTVKVQVTDSTVTLTGTTVSNIKFLVEETTALTSGVTATSDGVKIAATAGVKIGTDTVVKKLATGSYTVSAGWRTKNSEYVGTVGSISSLAELYEIFGAATVDNPMALACLFALLAGGSTVYFTGINSEVSSAYLVALDLLDNDAYSNVYSIVPMTNDATIIGDLAAAVKRSSEDYESKVRRTLWYGLPDLKNDAVNDLVNDLIDARKARTQSYRAQAVWCPLALYNGTEVPNYILAAAPAGMRAGQAPHRPLSNLTYDFFSVGKKVGKSQLLKLGAEGIWIIDNNYEGTPCNKKQVTTAVSNNLNLDEESIVSNADSIALVLCHIGESIVGCSNISPTLIQLLADTISITMDGYTTDTTGNPYVGAQLLDWTLIDIYQDETSLDHIYANISCQPPKPFNRFTMTLQIV